MRSLIDEDDAALPMLAAMIAHSQIVVAASAKRLPVGFADLDVAILEWIAAEGHRLGRRLPLM